MSCEPAWWHYVGQVNATHTAVQTLTALAARLGGMRPEDTLLLSQPEVDDLLKLIGAVDAAFRVEAAGLEEYYYAMRGAGHFANSYSNGGREHDV